MIHAEMVRGTIYDSINGLGDYIYVILGLAIPLTLVMGSIYTLNKQGRIKGLTMMLNRNNRSVLVSRYSVLREKIGPILPPLVGLMAGRQRGR